MEKVFDWFKNPRNWATLNPAAAHREELTDVHVTREGLGTFQPLPGVRFECFGVFTEFVPNKRIVDRWSLALEGSETYTFDAEGSGTRVTLQTHPRSFWRLWPLDKLVARFEGRENERALARLKDFMDASSAPAKVSGLEPPPTAYPCWEVEVRGACPAGSRLSRATRLPACFPVPARTDQIRRPVIL